MDLERYSRQTLFAGIGEEGQKRLANSHAVIIGCGALGSMQAEMLARAGVGRLRLIDRDFIEESNLQRQIMFEERDAVERLPKAVAAEARIKRINSKIQVDAIVKDIDYSNIEDMISDADVILDGSDNFETRFLINDAAVKMNKPWIYGAAVGSYGLQMTIRPHLTPCLRCLFPDLPAAGSAPTCDTAGVILPVVATVASYQVSEALKLLTGQSDKLHDSLLSFDLWENGFKRLPLAGVRGEERCPACEKGRYDFLTARARQLTMTLCGRDAVQITPAETQKLDFAFLAERLRTTGEVSYNAYLLKFRSGAHEITVFPDARCIIKGTDDPNVARSLYARFIGA
jgi:molybdopterin-synthase adenylyltransferase